MVEDPIRLNKLAKEICCLQQKISRLERIIPQPSSSGATNFLVWRPGGVAGGNVYTDFNALHVALLAIQGFKFVAVDTSIAPAVVPLQSYNMAGTKLIAYNKTPNPTVVTMPPGAQFVDLAGIDNFLQLSMSSTGVPNLIWTPAGGGFPNFFTMGVGSRMVSATPDAPIQLFNEGLIIAAFDGAILGDANFPVININDPSGLLVAVALDFGQIADNFLSGAVGNAQVQYLDSSSIPAATPLFFGTINYAPAPTVPGGLIYIDSQTGSDTQGNGSRQRPYQTLQKGLNVSKDNDTLLLSPGLYNSSVIPTNPVRAHLTIEGQGSSSQDSDGVVIQDNLAIDALTYLPTSPAEANAIRSLTLRKLKFRSAAGCGIMAMDTTPGASSFLDEGLMVEDCHMVNALLGVCTYKVGNVEIRSSKADGLLFEQTSTGRIQDTQAFGTLTLNTNTTVDMPVAGRGTMQAYGSTILQMDLEGNPSLYVDPSSEVTLLLGGLLIVDGAIGTAIQFEGRSNLVKATIPPNNNPTDQPFFFDRSRLNEIDLNQGGVVRNPISAQGAVIKGTIKMVGAIDIDLRNSQYDPAMLTFAGGSTADETNKFASAPGLGAGATPVVFTVPYPASVGSNYTISPETDSASSIFFTGKTPTQFVANASAGTNARFVAIRP